jgi:hypothetical protein
VDDLMLVYRNPATGELYYPASYVDRLRAALERAIEAMDAAQESLPDWSMAQRFLREDIDVARAALAGGAEPATVPRWLCGQRGICTPGTPNCDCDPGPRPAVQTPVCPDCKGTGRVPVQDPNYFRTTECSCGAGMKGASL